MTKYQYPDFFFECLLLSLATLLFAMKGSAEIELRNSTRQFLEEAKCQVETRDLTFELDECNPIVRPVEVCRGLCATHHLVQTEVLPFVQYCGNCKPVNNPVMRKMRLVFKCSDGSKRTKTFKYYKIKHCGCSL